MSGHAKLAPSSAARWIACPGSIRLSEGIPDVESPAAAEGTFAHEVAARCLETGKNASEFLGFTDCVHTLDEEMAEHVQTYVDVVRSLVTAGSKLHVEKKVRFKNTMLEPHAVFGTADAIVWKRKVGVVEVVDLKFGTGVKVDVHDNAQLKIYALGALTTLRVMDLAFGVRVHIVQPRHYAGGHSSEFYLVEDLVEWALKVLIPAAHATARDGADVVPGDHCRWCLAKSKCPALREESLKRTQHLFSGGDLSKPKKELPAPTELTNAQLGEALSAFETIETWMSALRAEAYNRAENRHEDIPGHKLVEKKGHRRWNDEGEAVKTMQLLGHDPFAKPKVKSPAQAEKLIGKESVAKLAHTPMTGTVLVPVSDRRPRKKVGSVFLQETKEEKE